MIDDEQPTLWKPGQRCPRSGFWIRVDQYGDDEINEGGDAYETTLSKGDRFPPSDTPGARYRFGRAPVHRDEDS